MKTLLTFAAALMLAGCGVFKTYVQNDAQAQMERDSAERQARLKAEGKLNAKELEAVSARMGWVRAEANTPLPSRTEASVAERFSAAASDASSNEVSIRRTQL